MVRSPSQCPVWDRSAGTKGRVRLARRVVDLDEEFAADQARITGLIRDSKGAVLLERIRRRPAAQPGPAYGCHHAHDPRPPILGPTSNGPAPRGTPPKRSTDVSWVERRLVGLLIVVWR
jgi:hypothetical protein